MLAFMASQLYCCYSKNMKGWWHPPVQSAIVPARFLCLYKRKKTCDKIIERDSHEINRNFANLLAQKPPQILFSSRVQRVK